MEPKNFYQWLYDLGKYDPLNAVSVIEKMLRNFSPFYKHPITDMSEGAKRQAIALGLLMRPRRLAPVTNANDTISWNIGNTDKGDYAWTLLNDNQKVHLNRDIKKRLQQNPAEHILGRYNVYETKDDYIIKDTYNFNKSGTNYAKNIKNKTTYDYIRMLAGYLSFGDTPVEIKIPKKRVNKYRQVYKNQNLPAGSANSTFSGYLFNSPGGLDTSVVF